MIPPNLWNSASARTYNSTSCIISHANAIFNVKDLNTLKIQKEYMNNVELEEFRDVLIDYARAASGAFAASVHDINYYEKTERHLHIQGIWAYTLQVTPTAKRNSYRVAILVGRLPRVACFARNPGLGKRNSYRVARGAHRPQWDSHTGL